MRLSISLLAAIGATAAAKTIVINVGQSGFTFSPDSVTADEGDMLEFHFFGSIHTAVQGEFSTPCAMGALASSGFDSGSISNKADGSGSVFQVMVENTDPMWFYCSAPTHCQGGMVGVVNPPSSGNSLATYRANAADTSSSQSAGKVQGGVVVPEGGSGSSSSSSRTTTPPASSTTPASESPSTSTTPTSSHSPSAPSSSTTASSESTPLQTSEASTETPTASSPPPVVTSSSSSPIAPGTGNFTSSATATTSPTFVPASGGGSLKETIRFAVPLSFVFGLGVIVVLMT